MAYSIQKTFCGLPQSCFSGHRPVPFCIPDGSAGDAPFQRRLVDVLTEHLLSSGKQGADQVFGLLGLGFPLRLDAGQHFICGNVVLADPAEATLVPRENASDAPGGARELFSWVKMRMVGSCFSLPMNMTLRTAAAMSMEPRPRCKLCIPAALFRCPISKIAQPVRCATCPSRMKIGRTSFARFMSTSAPRYAWIGSIMTSRALFSIMAFQFVHRRASAAHRCHQ